MSTEEQQSNPHTPFEQVFDQHLEDFEREVQILLLLKFISKNCDLQKFTAFCVKEKSDDDTQEWIDCISSSIRELGDPDIDLIPATDDEEASLDYVYQYASAIVEPNGLLIEESGYLAFQESDSWVSFITENFGDAWGKIADYVFVNGY